MAITKLDYEQVIQYSYDEPNNAIRVTAQISPPTGTQSITGDVSVNNFPTTQGVSGTVSISDTLHVYNNSNINSTSIQAVTGTYFEITSSTAILTKQIAVYDTTGSNLSIASGAISGEADRLFIGPGDSGTYPVQIPAGSRISIRSLDSTAPASGANIIVRLIG